MTSLTTSFAGPYDLLSLIDLQISLPNIRPSSRSIIPNQGMQFLLRPICGLSLIYYISWHEHDADEIQQVSELCIAEASKNLEKAGWAKESIKVIGVFPYAFGDVSI